MKILCITPIKHIPGLYEELRKYGQVIYKPDITKKNLAKLLKKTKVQALFTNPNKQNYKIDADVLKKTNVKVINTASTGLNHINLEVCNKLGIKVLSLTKDYELIKRLPSTAELAFGLMLSLLRRIPQSFDSVKKGEWNYEKFIGNQVEGLTAGIIGYGRLGNYFGKYCDAFGMKVIVHDPYKVVYLYEQVSLKELIKKADVVALHVHVTDETKGMINKKILKLMKPTAIIINTSRGEIVDEQELVKALQTKKIAGYGTDVLADEFENLKKSPILKGIKQGLNIIVTPHIGGMTWQGQKRAYLHAIKKFKNVRL